MNRRQALKTAAAMVLTPGAALAAKTTEKPRPDLRQPHVTAGSLLMPNVSLAAPEPADDGTSDWHEDLVMTIEVDNDQRSASALFYRKWMMTDAKLSAVRDKLASRPTPVDDKYEWHPGNYLAETGWPTELELFWTGQWHHMMDMFPLHNVTADRRIYKIEAKGRQRALALLHTNVGVRQPGGGTLGRVGFHIIGLA